MRVCGDCKGTGFNVREAFTYTNSQTGEQTHYPEKRTTCDDCQGTGMRQEPDKSQLWALIKGRKGLRTSRPDRKHGPRAYYVWRMARFHGGVDMTMPIMASLGIGKDPYRDELDKLADDAAKEFFGSDMRAAMRWDRALGHI